MSWFTRMYHFGLLPHVTPDVTGSIDTYQVTYPKLWFFVLIGIAVAGYLLGSINSALLVSRRAYHEDIRDFGSKNAGATNMMRTYGKGAAGLTLLGDILKGVLACAVGIVLLGERGGYVAGLFCIVGHVFPVWFGFRGGKGVATTAAVVLCLSPITFLVLFSLFVLLVALTRYISLGSVCAMLFYPFALWSFSTTGQRMAYFIACPERALIALAIAALVIYKHKENIRRLFAGKENKFSFHSTKKEKN